ncbi:MAG: LysR family transcriptional regulator [Paracoccus sp. (in: a-proteobacteria)]|nr:LysR family transcriptional regulator [Paracoccus sp. (in: a-proteobacteria)]
MKFKQLEQFLVVAEELHFRRAAARLNMTQSPLSTSISNLEDELGAPLFIRSQRRVELTELGERLKFHARSLLKQRDHCLDDLRSVIAGKAGQLRIGFTSASSLLSGFPILIQDFRNRFPDVEVVLHEAPSLRQIEALVRREIDIGILRRPMQTIPEDVSFRSVAKEPLIVALPASHPLADAPQIRVADLMREDFISFPRSMGVGIYDLLIRLCNDNGFTPNIVHEVDVSTTLVGLVAAGIGIAIVPMGMGYVRIPNIRFRELADEDAVTELLLAFRAGEQDRKVNHLIHMAQHSFANASRPVL